MKTCKKLTITLFLLILIGSSGFAQNNNSIGLRFGGTSGITYKHNSSFEAILGFWGNGISITALKEKSKQAFDAVGLNWYYGFGGHVAFFNDNDPSNDFGRGNRTYLSNEMAFGVDAIFGLEYHLPEIPFAISLGFKPFLEIDTDGRFYGAPDPGFGIKFKF
ncbi:hypothetical protein BFP97_15870 [Roseivirga sp. 4D4]|uniref:hypothetical protein n=1 Tax=Roseivirga sp. 4D4 TaxID=1889784 RepID=UPI0008530E61|nr:hypothetical protein [Roseivirga sp. 4D4]OEK02910.1 hypothetical protein BFP97_15870 [Roseivirga sp. 4D4]